MKMTGAIRKHPGPTTRFFSEVRDLALAVRALLPRGHLLPDALWQRSDRILQGLLWLHVPVILAAALASGPKPGHAVLEAGVVAGLAALAHLVRGRTLRSCVTSFGLLSCSAILVHLSGGVIELHFHFFVMLGAIALYQDWRPFGVAAGYVLVHHGVFGVIAPESVYNHADALAHPVRWAGIHAAFIAAASVVQLSFWRSNEQARAQEEQARAETQDQRARLELAAQRAEAAERSALLLRVTAGLSDARSPEQVARVVFDEGFAVLGARAGAVALREDRGSLLRVFATGYDADFTKRWSWVPLEADAPVAEAARRGEPIILQDRAAVLARYPALAADVRREGVEACVALPLASGGATCGAVLLTFPAPRAFGADDRAFLLTLAAQCAQSLERARLRKLDHEAAETLQRGLLPDRLPTVDGLAMAARYLAGTEGVQVGGDWYDCLRLPDGRVAVVLGDVVGKGLRAAATMGQIRYAVRAYASQGLGPAEVVRWVDRLGALEEDELATLAFGILDLDQHSLWLANAGHPPPLVVSSDGSVRYAEGDPGLPLGVDPGRDRPPVQRVDLEPGATIMLFSDGLVEGRDRALDEGLAELALVVARTAGRFGDDLDAWCEALLTAMLGDARDDDVALLVVRMLPVPSIVLPAEATGALRT